MHREGCLGEFGIDVSLGAPGPSAIGAVTADDVRNLPIELGAFRVRKKLSIGVLGGPLQRYVDIPGPDALEVWLAPRRLRRWPRLHCDRPHLARRRGSLACGGAHRQRD